MTITTDAITLWLSVVGLLGAIVTLMGVGLRMVKNWIDRLEVERKNAQEEMRALAAAAAEQCREDNASLQNRYLSLANQVHTEGREDKGRLISVVEMNAKALSKIADRLDFTPPHGHRAQG